MIASKEWVKSLLKKMNVGKYSTDEVRIGTWIDGKPIYRKVIQVATIASGNNYIPHGIENGDKLINAYGYCSTTTANNVVPFPLNCFWSSQYSMSLSNFNEPGHDKTIRFYVGSSVPSSYKDFNIIIEYTKTTD